MATRSAHFEPTSADTGKPAPSPAPSPAPAPSGTSSPPLDNHRGHAAREFWQIPRSGWRDIAVRTWNETNDDNISLLAAGVAFYSFLAFVPLLASIVLVYGIVVTPAEVAAHMQTLIRVLPTDAAQIIGDQLKNLTATPSTKSTFGLIFAVLLALYGSMRGATSMIGALNITYGEHETRNFLRTSLLSLAFTVGGVVAAIVAMVAISAMSLLGTWIHLPAMVAPLITAALWLVTALIASGLVAVIYRYGPDRQNVRWAWLTPGAVFASVGALLATFLFGLYVANFADYNATYGALGAVVSFLMWLYVTAFVVLLGSELNAEIERQTAQDTTTGPDKKLGQRGAVMADTVASDRKHTEAAAATAQQPDDAKPGQSPVLAPSAPTGSDDHANVQSAEPVAAAPQGQKRTGLICVLAVGSMLWHAKSARAGL